MSEIGINEKQIKYLENFSKNYTAKELILGTKLKNEIYNSKNKAVTTSDNLKITPEIFDEYLKLLNEKKIESTKKALGNLKRRSSQEKRVTAPPPTTVNLKTLHATPAVELPKRESIKPIDVRPSIYSSIKYHRPSRRRASYHVRISGEKTTSESDSITTARSDISEESSRISSIKDPPIPKFDDSDAFSVLQYDAESNADYTDTERSNHYDPAEIDYYDDQKRNIYNPNYDTTLDGNTRRYYGRIQELLQEHNIPPDNYFNDMTVAQLRDAGIMNKDKLNEHLLIAMILSGTSENTLIPDETQEKFIDDSIPLIKKYNEWIQSRKRLADDSTGESHWERPVISSMRTAEGEKRHAMVEEEAAPGVSDRGTGVRRHYTAAVSRASVAREAALSASAPAARVSAPGASALDPRLPDGWTKVYFGDGDIAYRNEFTNEYQTERPTKRAKSSPSLQITGIQSSAALGAPTETATIEPPDLLKSMQPRASASAFATLEPPNLRSLANTPPTVFYNIPNPANPSMDILFEMNNTSDNLFTLTASEKTAIRKDADIVKKYLELQTRDLTEFGDTKEKKIRHVGDVVIPAIKLTQDQFTSLNQSLDKNQEWVLDTVNGNKVNMGYWYSIKVKMQQGKAALQAMALSSAAAAAAPTSVLPTPAANSPTTYQRKFYWVINPTDTQNSKQIIEVTVTKRSTSKNAPFDNNDPENTFLVSTTQIPKTTPGIDDIIGIFNEYFSKYPENFHIAAYANYYILKISVYASDYVKFINKILSREELWIIKPFKSIIFKSIKKITLPGSWFDTIEEVKVIPRMNQNFRFMDSKLVELEKLLNKLNSLEQQGFSIRRTFIKNPEAEIQRTKAGMQKAIDDVTTARDFNRQFLDNHQANLPYWYADKSNRDLKDIIDKKLQPYIRKLSPGGAAAVSTSSHAPGQVSGVSPTPNASSLPPKKPPPLPPRPAGMKESLLSREVSPTNIELNTLYQDFIVNTSEAKRILKSIEQTIDSLTVGGYDRNAMINGLKEWFDQAAELITKSSNIMNKRFGSDDRLLDMIAELQAVNNDYMYINSKYQELKDERGNLPPPVPNLFALQAQPVGQPAAAAAPVASSLILSEADMRQLPQFQPASASVSAPPNLQPPTLLPASAASPAVVSTEQAAAAMGAAAAAAPSSILPRQTSQPLLRLPSLVAVGQSAPALQEIPHRVSLRMVELASLVQQNLKLIDDNFTKNNLDAVAQLNHDTAKLFIELENLITQYEQYSKFDQTIKEFYNRRKPDLIEFERRRLAAVAAEPHVQAYSVPITPVASQGSSRSNSSSSSEKDKQGRPPSRASRRRSIQASEVPADVTDQATIQKVDFENFDLYERNADTLLKEAEGILSTKDLRQIPKLLTEIDPYIQYLNSITQKYNNNQAIFLKLTSIKDRYNQLERHTDFKNIDLYSENADTLLKEAEGILNTKDLSQIPGLLTQIYQDIQNLNSITQKFSNNTDIFTGLTDVVKPIEDRYDKINRRYSEKLKFTTAGRHQISHFAQLSSVPAAAIGEQNAYRLAQPLVSKFLQVAPEPVQTFPSVPGLASRMPGFAAARGSASGDSFSDYTHQGQGAAAVAALQRAREPSPLRSSNAAAKQSERPVSPTFRPGRSDIIIENDDSIKFNFDTRSGVTENIQDVLMPDAELNRLHDKGFSLKKQESNLRENLDDAISNYNIINRGPMLKVIQYKSGVITFNLPPNGSRTAEGKKLFSSLRNIGLNLYNCLKDLEEIRVQINERKRLYYAGGSQRSSHLAKHTHKNKNKTKHKHNYNHKARPNRKNKKTIKKYRGMSRMPVMPRMQKQNVVVYRKHKKTTRKYKATRHAKMNKNKPKNSNKKSRKFRR
jgi:hypothetical protein